jgi:putative transferase (TIGR04331 family)
MSRKIFLALTALEEFWDIKREIKFLGPWCILYRNKSVTSKLHCETINSCWNNSNKRIIADQYIDVLIERILPKLADHLNSFHKVDRSYKYWHILLYPWIHQYVNVLYERYMTIKNAVDEVPDFTTIVLAKDSFVVPDDTLDFVALMKCDEYNLQLYTVIISFLGYSYPEKKYQVKSSKLRNRSISFKLRKVINFLSNYFYRVLSRSNSIVLSSSYFSRKSEFLLFLLTAFKVRPVYHDNYSNYKSATYNERSGFTPFTQAENKFENLLNKVILKDIPSSFVENYVDICTKSSHLYPRSTKAIFASTNWYFNELFKFSAGALVESGALVLATQHGGNHGSLKNMPVLDNEIKFSDYYFSWGWHWGKHNKKIMPMPATKLVGRKPIGADNTKNGILFAGSEMPRYSRWVLNDPCIFEDRLHSQFFFINDVPLKIAKNIFIRLNPVNHGWDQKLRLNDNNVNIQFDDLSIPFFKSLSKCRLFITNNLSTTFAEALSANVPTLLFWNPEFTMLTKEAQKYYDLLHSVGVLLYSASEASAVVESIYDDVEGWWYQPNRQKAVKLFCTKIALRQDHEIHAWSSKFTEIFNNDSK